ncbi:DNA cytosine methyltransferase [Paenibacillus macerans]|uniref:DNA cytosine methyltransferase n=1 Tax=Paenibacillus TaxID=44249 RepID=UPI0007C63F06|nr:DNA cytosine methyltransferase [Paenibacillus macerans]MBS5911156.1 DNA cytosine methyltransferase [Paenibacillus macerans]MCY7562336.1 DNA cytosine methyltransferase [Paenibacillus macerans]MEC0137598.1 DNA cytosine methyltransferase [Paenibacillus macerans]MEC0149013.1 DNA cytosine methyltransferase [Paenibacillus macerans]OMG46599.1 DNA cytosine methyltransferase [Paenibacillus macerans]
MSKRYTAIDLFAGAGGMSLGFEQAGFDVLAAVEYDPIHASIHQYNFPQTKVICADVSKITGHSILEQLGKKPGEIDVVFGGPPCQGFSMIGRRLADDERNILLFHFYKIISEVRPKYFVMENVSGLTVGNAKNLLQTVINEFQGIGYEITLPYKVLNASSFGVPQSRKRLFLYGAYKGNPVIEYPEPTVIPREIKGTPPTAKTKGLPIGPSVYDAIADLPNVDLFEELLTQDWIEFITEPKSDYARYLAGLLTDKEDLSLPRIFNRNILTSSMRTKHNDESKKRFVETEQGQVEPVSRFLKLHPEGVSNTLRAGSDSKHGAFTSPRPIHYIYPRVITVREAARLHSFPDWFRFHVTKWHGFREVGNAVPPLLARAVAKQISKALGGNVKQPVQKISLSNEELLSYNMAAAAKEHSVSKDVIGKRDREAIIEGGSRVASKYDKIISDIFFSNYRDGLREFNFVREDIERSATKLGIKLPKNIGDVIYSYRFRKAFPKEILDTCSGNEEWTIEGAGDAKYKFKLFSSGAKVVPSTNLFEIKIPDSTPEIIAKYAVLDEQALLARVRYNRLIDIFTGITTYSLQNHLRTKVPSIGQIEIDEIYVGVNKKGEHFIIPVQAKSGNDSIGITQVKQDLEYCNYRYPTLKHKAIAVHAKEPNLIAMFELIIQNDELKVVEERHYRLVPASEISDDDLRMMSDIGQN